MGTVTSRIGLGYVALFEKEEPLVFIDREGKPGGGKGLLISKDKTFTLSGLRQNLLVWETENGSVDADGCDNSETE